MKIYLDFDGTVVEHAYPKIGRTNFGCIEVIEKLQKAGHEIILNTYRADENKEALAAALSLINERYWMLVKDRNLMDHIKLEPIKATDKKIQPDLWNVERAKHYQEMYIDDTAYGIPLKKCVMIEGYMVDWDELDKQFIEHKIYKQ